MKKIKFLLIGIVALLAVIIGGAFVALQFVDEESLIAKAQEQVKKQTGRDVALSSDISIGIGYAGGVAFHPSVTLRDVKLSNAEWSNVPNMFEAGEVGVGVSLLPLISGEVAVDYITLKDANITLEKSKSGEENWKFATKEEIQNIEEAVEEELEDQVKPDAVENDNPGAKEAADREEAMDPAPFRFDTITLENVTVSYRDAQTKMNETATINSADISGAGELDAAIKATYKQLDVALNAKADSLQAAMEKRVSIDLDVFGLGTDIDVEGKISPIEKAVGFVGDIDVSIENLAKLAPLAPNLPTTAPLSFEAKVNGTPKGANIKNAVLDYAGQEVRLNLDADLTGKVPAITFDAKADRLDMAKLASKKTVAPAADGVAKAGAGAAATAKPATAEAKAASAGMIPNIALPLGAVATLPVSAKGTIHIGEFVQDKLTLKNIKLALNAAPGNLSATLSPLSLASGTLNGNVGIRANSATSGTTSIALNAVKLNAEQLIRIGGNASPSISDGEVTMALKLSGSGDSLPKMLGSANGNTQLLMNGASYDAPAIESIKAFLTFLGGGKKVEEINIACAFTAAGIAGGVAKTNVLTLQTDAAQVDGSGTISMKDETLNMTLKPRSSMIGITDLVPPLKLSGKWASPSVSLDEQSSLLSLGKLALGAGTGGISLAILGGNELLEKSDVFKDNPCVKQAQTAAPEQEQKKPEAALKEVGKNVEDKVKSIRDAFEGKPSEPGAAKKGKEERVIDGLNAVKGLFGH